MVATLHLVYDLDSDVLVAATLVPPIVMTQATIFPLDFLFVAAVPKFEFSCCLSHVLALTLHTGSQIDNKVTITS